MNRYEAPRWRFAVTTRAHVSLCLLDGLASDRRVERLLDESWSATGTVPSSDPYRVAAVATDGDPYVAEGNRFLLGFRRSGAASFVIAYGGVLLQLEDVVEDGVPVTHYTAFDSWKLLEQRPVLHDDLTFPGESGVIYEATPGNEIVAQLYANTRDANGSAYVDVPVAFGGSAFYAGVFNTTAAIDATFQRGANVGEAWSQIVATGTIDVVLRPVYDPVNRPGILAELCTYAQAGTTLNSAVFSWNRPPYSLVAVSRLEDGTLRANKVQLYGGDGTPAALKTDAASVTKYGEAWSLQQFPGQAAPAAVEAFATERLLLRKNRRTTLTLSPAPTLAPRPIDEYDLGDRVRVYASKLLRKAISGFVRVYGIVFLIDDDSLESVELHVSADAL